MEKFEQDLPITRGFIKNVSRHNEHPKLLLAKCEFRHLADLQERRKEYYTEERRLVDILQCNKITDYLPLAQNRKIGKQLPETQKGLVNLSGDRNQRGLETVKWFNVESGYGSATRDNTREDIFVHQKAVIRNNPQKTTRSVDEGLTVEFDIVVGDMEREAGNGTRPYGAPAQGSPYAADRRHLRSHWSRTKHHSN